MVSGVVRHKKETDNTERERERHDTLYYLLRRSTNHSISKSTGAMFCVYFVDTVTYHVRLEYLPSLLVMF